MSAPLTRVEGRAYPLGRANVDTDAIIAAEHLKTVSRAGLGVHAFAAMRAAPDNVFDDPRFKGAPILMAGANFGCGSSREHAAWALLDMGITAVIAPSFSDIFASNAVKNGIAPVELDPEAVARLLDLAGASAILVDLESQSISAPDGTVFRFNMDPFRRECLLTGADEIALTLVHEPAILAYEQRAA